MTARRHAHSIRLKLFFLAFSVICASGCSSTNIDLYNTYVKSGVLENSSPEADFNIPDYLELPSIGETYQVKPYSDAPHSADYSFESEASSIISVDENGLITVLKNGVCRVYVTGTDTKTAQSFSKEIFIVAGDVKIFQPSFFKSINKLLPVWWQR